MQKLRLAHCVEGYHFCKSGRVQVGQKNPDNPFCRERHFVETASFIVGLLLRTAHIIKHLHTRHSKHDSKRDIRGPPFPLHPSHSPCQLGGRNFLYKVPVFLQNASLLQNANR